MMILLGEGGLVPVIKIPFLERNTLVSMSFKTTKFSGWDGVRAIVVRPLDSNKLEKNKDYHRLYERRFYLSCLGN